VTGGPVRLKVAYKSPEALVGELTRSVGRGGVRIESHRALPIGTRFVFELKSQGVGSVVEVPGTVMSVSESAPGRWILHIRYEPPPDREGLDAVINRIFETARVDAKRKHARIPLQVRAVEDKPHAPTFRLRDISLGGVGIDVESEKVPAYIRAGVPFVLQMKLTRGHLLVRGEVAWVVQTRQDGLTPRVGVTFNEITEKTSRLLGDLLSLRVLPSPPWIARLAFGEDAYRIRE
jgi:PilZ domain